MKQFISFVQKEFYHVFRDPKTMLLLFGMPLAQIVLFGFALTNEISNAEIVVCDYAKDDASFYITEQLAASTSFDVQKSLLSYEEIEDAFKYGDVKLAVVFPVGFNASLQHGHQAQVQIIADASDPNTANTLSNYARQIIMGYRTSLQAPQVKSMQVGTELRMIYNPELKGVTNFVPGVMALVLLLISVLMTSVSIVKEKETGTMEVLLVSPTNPFMVIASKALPYFFLSILNLTLILLLSIAVMGMPMNGSYLLLYFTTSIFILTALCLGLLISNVTNTQQEAMLFSLMGMLVPSLLFTGFMFPLENMPYFLQVIANVVPSKWYYIIVKSVMIQGLGIEAIWRELSILMGMTVFLLLLSTKKFKVRLV